MQEATAAMLAETQQFEKFCCCQGLLSETIQHIKSSLTAQNQQGIEEQKEEEKDHLKQLLENEQLRSDLEFENLQGWIKELEFIELTEMEKQLEAERKWIQERAKGDGGESQGTVLNQQFISD